MTPAERYLYVAHGARGRSILVSIAVGALGGGFLEFFEVPIVWCALGCILITVGIQLILARRYIVATQHTREKPTPTLSVRRYVLQLASYAGVAVFLGLIRVPEVEATILDRRLREITASGQDYDRASEIIRYAMETAVSLSPPTLESLRGQVVKQANAASLGSIEVAVSNRLARPLSELAAYQFYLETGIQLRVHPGTVYIPAGEPGKGYRIAHGLFAKNVTLVGESRSDSVIIADFASSPQSPAVFWYRGEGPKADAIITQLTVRNPLFNVTEAPALCLLTSRDSSLAVYEVGAINLTQPLERILWVDVLFRNCRVIYSGGSLYLRNVAFESCEFVGDGVKGQEIADKLRAFGSAPVTLTIKD